MEKQLKKFGKGYLHAIFKPSDGFKEGDIIEIGKQQKPEHIDYGRIRDLIREELEILRSR